MEPEILHDEVKRNSDNHVESRTLVLDFNGNVRYARFDIGAHDNFVLSEYGEYSTGSMIPRSGLKITRSEINRIEDSMRVMNRRTSSAVQINISDKWTP